MTKFEEQIRSGVLAAGAEYRNLSGGGWLSHAPESYLSTKLGQELGKYYCVYFDTSFKRVLADAIKKPGKMPGGLSQRSDLSIWYKSKDEVLAAIEVKRAYNVGPVLEDCAKLEKIVALKKGPSLGYVVAYSEAKPRPGRQTLERRFERWASESGWSLISAHVELEKSSDGWTWGFCILRNPKK